MERVALVLAFVQAAACTGRLTGGPDIVTMNDPPPLESSPDGGSSGSDAGALNEGPCVAARRLWGEDFERGDYSRWTSQGYGNDWGTESGACRENGFATDQAHAGQRSHRSIITCPSHTDVHRGYGGIQLSGESVLPGYTNSGVGLDAPHGIVTTFWSRLDVPYALGGGRWISLFTVNTDCAWNEEVITLGLDQPSNRLTPAHVASTDFAPNAPSFPLREWVRVTIYVNAYSGEMYVWQNGQLVSRSTFTRPTNDLCQWHWGLYASGDNDSVVLHEDDLSLWKLDAPLADLSREPWLDAAPICD